MVELAIIVFSLCATLVFFVHRLDKYKEVLNRLEEVEKDSGTQDIAINFMEKDLKSLHAEIAKIHSDLQKLKFK